MSVRPVLRHPREYVRFLPASHSLGRRIRGVNTDARAPASPLTSVLIANRGEIAL